MSQIVNYAVLTSPQTDDVLPIVDVHDSTMSPAGTTKKITVAALLALATGAVSSVNGHVGPVVLTASDVSADPTGAAATAQSNAETFATSAAGTAQANAETFATSAVATETARAEAAEVTKLPLAGGTLTGAIVPAVAPLTDAATVVVNAALGNDLRLLMTSGVGATRQLGNPANPANGQRIDVMVTQDGVGGRLLTYGTAYSFGAAGAPTLSVAAGALDIIGFIYNTAKAKWLFAGIMLGY
jgi:hypothetical protein